MGHRRSEDRGRGVEELAERLRQRRGRPVVVATAGGEVRFGYVGGVDEGLLVLHDVAFYSPACPCQAVEAGTSWVPLKAITDVLEELVMPSGAKGSYRYEAAAGKPTAERGAG
jgi:hypothetical protein